MIVLEDLEIEKKLEILSDAAKYDVACTSSGVERKGNREGMGNATHCGICHSFAADGRCISLLKVLMTNECIYDCKYCINRRSNDTVRTSFTPQELCELTIQFYRRNYVFRYPHFHPTGRGRQCGSGTAGTLSCHCGGTGSTEHV